MTEKSFSLPKMAIYHLWVCLAMMAWKKSSNINLLPKMVRKPCFFIGTCFFQLSNYPSPDNCRVEFPFETIAAVRWLVPLGTKNHDPQHTTGGPGLKWSSETVEDIFILLMGRNLKKIYRIILRLGKHMKVMMLVQQHITDHPILVDFA